MTECQSIILTLVGVLIGGTIGYFSALRVAGFQSHNQAASKFRAAFSEQVYQLQIGKDDIFKILSDNAYTSHLKARIEFEPYLSNNQIILLNEVWEKYYQYRNCEGQNIAPGSMHIRKEEILKSQEILKEILFFAKNK